MAASRIGQPWGRRQPPHTGPVSRRRSRHDAAPDVAQPWLPWGNGRSYGDVCTNRDGALIDSRAADRILAFDADAGRITCEAGILLADLQQFLLPRGWFLPVVPGTELITLGGAIANDVHGKNHHRNGSFGHHVRWLELMDGTGQVHDCQPGDERLQATIGGLGLTGLILRAEIALQAIQGSGWLQERGRRTRTLDETLDTLAEVDTAHEHTAAWIDCLARGARLGRGVVFAADDVDGRARRTLASLGTGLHVPLTPPISPIQPLTLRAFNALYYRARRDDTGWQTRGYRQVLHPLDRIGDWNRLYGRRGFVQCQVCVPDAGHREALRAMIDAAARVGEGSFLVVLKKLGTAEPPGILSFARDGYTLALDFPWRGKRTRTLVRTLYDIALDAGGGIYPAKDAVMTPAQFRRSFPAWDAFVPWRDPAFDSDFARRVELA